MRIEKCSGLLSVHVSVLYDDVITSATKKEKSTKTQRKIYVGINQTVMNSTVLFDPTALCRIY